MMVSMSRRNIAYDLTISPYRVTQPYGESKIEFVFSSALYRRKFIERQQANRDEINQSLSKRFAIDVDLPLLADIRLYKNIEKRGFLIYKDGESICQDNLVLDGNQVSNKATKI